MTPAIFLLELRHSQPDARAVELHTVQKIAGRKSASVRVVNRAPRRWRLRLARLGCSMAVTDRHRGHPRTTVNSDGLLQTTPHGLKTAGAPAPLHPQRSARLARAYEVSAQAFDLEPGRATPDVVVDQAHRLHE